jgi:hypothetical protein
MKPEIDFAPLVRAHQRALREQMEMRSVWSALRRYFDVELLLIALSCLLGAIVGAAIVWFR